MNFLKAEGANLIFHLGKREKSLLLDLLKMYPVIPPAHHRISSACDSPEAEANQNLLDEALAEHRAASKRALDAMLAESNRFEPTAGGFLLKLTAEQLEWLLQVLNDVRVGSWIHLGSPDGKSRHARLSIKNARYLWAMELCGQFQFSLLHGRTTP